MNKLRIFILLLIIPFGFAYTQDPNVEQNFSVISDVNSSLENIYGWSLQDNGKWANEKYVIPFTDSKTNKDPNNKYKLGIENTKKLELKKVLIEDKQYNVLFRIYKDGEYEFPLLHEGWESYESVEYFVFYAENLANVFPKDLPFNKAFSVNLNVYCYGVVRHFDSKTIDDKVVNKIRSTRNYLNLNASNLIIGVMPTQDKNGENVRFKLIRSFNEPNIYTIYLDPANWPKLFENTYYSTKYHQFKSFIKDSEVYNLPIDSEGTDFKSLYNYGIVKYQAGDFEGAITNFNSALYLKPDTAFSLIYSYRGISKVKMGNHSEAIDDFDRAIDIRPTDVMYYSNWIKNYFNRGVSKFYVNDFDGACGDWEKSFELGYGRALDYLEKFCY